MQHQPTAEIRDTYRALLARGLQPREAANLTAFLHGLSSTNLRWSVGEVEALVLERQRRATETRLTEGSAAGGGTTTATT